MTNTTRTLTTTRHCAADGCTKARKALSLCSTHYNRTLPNRHGKVMKPCDTCGTLTPKEARTARYIKTYCTELCRQWDQFGAWTTNLPPDHWAILYGKTCHSPIRYYSYDCAWCGHPSTSPHRDATYCSDAHKRRARKQRRRATQFNSPGQHTWAQVTKLWTLFDRACAYCHTPTQLADIQAEHVHPLSKGGRNDVGNILPSCAACNSDKRDLLLTEWNADRVARRLPSVTVTWDAQDHRYAHIVPPRQLLAA